MKRIVNEHPNGRTINFMCQRPVSAHAIPQGYISGYPYRNVTLRMPADAPSRDLDRICGRSAAQRRKPEAIDNFAECKPSESDLDFARPPL